MQQFSVGDDFKILSFFGKSMPETRIPDQRNNQSFGCPPNPQSNCPSTLTFRVRASSISVSKESIPTLQKWCLVHFHQLRDFTQLGAVEPSSFLQNHRFQPKLCPPVFTPDVDMRWFTPVKRGKPAGKKQKAGTLPIGNAPALHNSNTVRR